MKLCLRCDWEGETRATACPECGAPLFVRREGAATKTGTRRRRRSAVSEPPERATRPRRERRRRGGDAENEIPPGPGRARAVVPVAVIAVVATTAFFVIRSSTPQELTTTQGADLRGVLLYTAPEDGRWRLWRWDLPTWTATPGPLLDERPIELLNARVAGEGVVGLTQANPDGQTARILRHLEESDRATTLIAGTRVAWTRSGASAVAASVVEPDAAGCGHLLLRSFEVDLGEGEEIFRERICGELTALGLSYTTAFVTLLRDSTFGTYEVRAGRYGSSLDGWGLIGASPTGTLLVVPTGALPLETPQPLFRSGSGSLLGQEGPLGRGEPVAYGAGDDRLAFRSLLGWASTSGGAYVLGSYAGERGIYMIAVDGGEAVSEPVRIAPIVGSDVSLTETAGAATLVAVDGRFYRARQGDLNPLEAPPDAPSPVGPILWLPSVPDSA